MPYQTADIKISKKTIGTINKIFSEWGCCNKERLSLLGVSEQEYELISTCSELITCNINLRKRVGYILNINELLSIYFKNKENRTGFLKLNNEANLFNGSTPMNYIMKNGSTKALEDVHLYLKDILLKS
jgi:hypothetical protein